jgi:hypothetical protein
MKPLFLIALISISIPISILLIAPSHVFVFAILSNQTSSNQTATTNSLLKQILNELQQIRQLQQHPVLPTPPTNPGCGLGTDNSLCNVPVPPPPAMAVPVPPPFNATTCKQQNDNGVLITNCANPVFPGLGQQQLPPPPTPPANLPPAAAIPIPPPLLAWLPPDLGMGAVTDCIYTGYGVFCPTN